MRGPTSAPERRHHDPAEHRVRADEGADAAVPDLAAHAPNAADVEDRRGEADGPGAGRILDERERDPAPVAGSHLGERPDVERFPGHVEHRARLGRGGRDLRWVPLRDETRAVARPCVVQPGGSEPLPGQALGEPRRERRADGVVAAGARKEEHEPSRPLVGRRHDRRHAVRSGGDEDRELPHAGAEAAARSSAQPATASRHLVVELEPSVVPEQARFAVVVLAEGRVERIGDPGDADVASELGETVAELSERRTGLARGRDADEQRGARERAQLVGQVDGGDRPRTRPS